MRITEVTLLEDRGQVTRRGSVELSAGLNTVTVEGVAPVIVDKTVAVQISAASARCVDTQVRRRKVIENVDRGADSRALREEAEALDRRLQELQALWSRASSEVASFERSLELAHTEIAEDASWGRGPTAENETDLNRVREQLGEARARRDTLAHERDEGQERRARLEARIQAAEQPSEEYLTHLELTIEAEREATADLEVKYLVPGACWRPLHVAQLLPGDGEVPQLSFRTEACIWQNTGEDWEEVEVRLSTERPSLGVSPPVLVTDTLRTRPKDKAVIVETREEEIDDAGLGQGSGPTPKVTVSDVPGIDDGGEVRHLSAASKARIPSDGRPVRVALDERRTEVELSRVLMPDLAPQVFLKTVQTNGSQPLLPGPVELIREGGRVGQTSVNFVAAGERFELGWGPEPEIRVQRKHQEDKAKSRMLSAWTTVPHEVEVLISNIGPHHHTLEVVERIPVSEIEKVKVTPLPDKTTGRVAPDRDGFVRWTLELEPFRREKLELGYELQKHQDVTGI
ncbi:MAG: mucoidy inhibitor MuiA family protein [Myxococcota bacterium]